MNGQEPYQQPYQPVPAQTTAQPGTSAQQAPVSAGYVMPGRHHVHKSVVALWTLRMVSGFVVAIFAVAIGFIFDDDMQQVSIFSSPLLLILACVGILVLLAVLSFVVSFISYKRFTWEISDTELHVYQGIIVKKNTHIPFARIHSLDSTAKLLDRILGLVTLNVQTAGSSKPEATLSGLKLADAEAIRAEIFTRKRMEAAGIPFEKKVAGTASFAAAASSVVNAAESSINGTFDQVERSIGQVAHGANLMGELDAVSNSVRGAFGGNAFFEDEPIEFEYKITNRELFLSALSGKSISAVFIGILVVFGQLASFAGMSESFFDQMLSQASHFFLSTGIVLIALITFGVVLVIWVFAVLANVVSFGGFVVRRKAGRIEIERGLLSHRFNGIAIDRIQSVVVKQGIIRRFIGYAEVVVSTVSNVSSSDSSKGNDGQTSSGIIVRPFIKMSEVDAFIAGALPEFADAPHAQAFVRLPQVALRRSLFRCIVWPALIYGLCALIFNLVASPLITSGAVSAWFAPLLALVLLIPGALYGFFWFKNAAYAFDDKMLVMRKGGFGIETSYIPRRKIQWFQVAANPFQKIAGVETIKAFTAAGDSGTKNMLRDVARDEADDLLDWIRPHGKRVSLNASVANAPSCTDVVASAQ